MIKLEHTPGPWEKGNLTKCECKDGYPNCWHTFEYQIEIYPPLGESGPVAIASSESNGLLIAAAPEMLDALKKAKEFIDNGIEFGYIKMPDIEIDTALKTPKLINDTIEKATGKKIEEAINND